MSFPKPPYHEMEEFINRQQKLKDLQSLNIEPYPHKFSPSISCKDLYDKYLDEQDIGHSDDAAEGKTPSFKLAGRLVLFRAMGKNAFAHIQDSTGRMQIMLNRNLTSLEGYEKKQETDPAPLKIIEKKFDLGDIIGVEGNLFRTQKGELTLFVKKAHLLCKVLLPLPDKHSGLADKGQRYRKRWLDLIVNPESKNVLVKRSTIIKLVRHYFEKKGFIEVETPILQNSYGGAQAKPFTTHLHALHQDMFLRISLEIPLKKLIVGGLDRIFEIGKVFRNEGLDRTHNPEFTLLEAYAAYLDYNDLMELIENLYEHIALTLFQSTKISIDGHTIDVKAPWPRITMIDSLKKFASIDINKLSDEEIKEKLLYESKIDPKSVKKTTRGALIAEMFEEFVEDKLIQPCHIIDHPIETTPLCKPHRKEEDRKKGLVERFESFILGGELVNAYSELNDPILQRDLLEQQAQKRLEGDEEANPLDEEFIEAICQGMPPTAGLGIGLDRLIMFFTKAETIKDVIYFPLLKPEE